MQYGHRRAENAESFLIKCSAIVTFYIFDWLVNAAPYYSVPISRTK